MATKWLTFSIVEFFRSFLQFKETDEIDRAQYERKYNFKELQKYVYQNTGKLQIP